MGKGEQDLRRQQQSQEAQQQRHSSSRLICPGCSAVFHRLAKDLSFRCVFVLILGLAVFLAGIFWILPYRVAKSGFDAREEIKLSATVQANFRLEKPVVDLVPHIGRLEYDINGEIGVPGTTVAVLSMHQPDASNWTNVVFGVLSDPINVPIIPVSLSVLKSSLVELFLQHSNLTLTSSIFGQPSAFEIVKFPGGITVIPPQSASIWEIPQILFNFTLNNSIQEIVDNFAQLKEQLKFGLRLRSDEIIFLQVTNKMGSTEDRLVVVQAYLMGIVPQRLKQLAQTITGSPAKNLGLDNSVFGKVKSVSLSSHMKGTPSSTSPIPSPAPSPEPSISPSPAPPVHSRALPPDIHHLPPTPAPQSHHVSPTPSKVPAHPRPCPYYNSRIPPSSPPTSRSSPTLPPTYAPSVSPYSSPSVSPSSQMSPHLSPAPLFSYAASPRNRGSAQDLTSPSPAPSLSSLAVGPSYKEIRLLELGGLFIIYLLCWLH